jgi:O-Antigen ligase
MFFGGGAADGSLAWLGLAAVAVLLYLLATQPPPSGLLAFAPLAGLAVWCAVSIRWSTQGDRSWAYANRTFLYLAFALVGAFVAARMNRFPEGFAVVLGALCAWSLAGKVVPWLPPGYGCAANAPGCTARLVGPVGYWNALALLGDVALPLALWLGTRSRTRVAGALLAFGWIVAIGLTYSRAGAIVGVLAILAWIVVSRAWTTAIATLVAGGVPAAVALAVAFLLPGVTGVGHSTTTRFGDGLLFGAALVAGGYAASLLARLPPPEPSAAVERTAAAVVAVAVAAGIVFAAVHGHSWWDQFTAPVQGELSNGPGRVVSAGSNHRWVWWQEAWHGFQAHKVGGTGAGTFDLTNQLYRTTVLDSTIEPHNVPLQFLSETGVVGLLLYLGAVGSLVWAARRRRGGELALALALPIFFVHSLGDMDWDYAAVAAPVFMAAGVVAARPSERPRVSAFGVLAAAGVGLLLVFSLFSVWLADRWTTAAFDNLGTNSARAITYAQRARSLNPLAVEPLLWQAEAESAQAFAKKGDERRQQLGVALGLYQKAVKLQPHNEEAWWSLADFNFRVRHCAHAAYPEFERAYELNSQDPALAEKDANLALVNSGRSPC